MTGPVTGSEAQARRVLQRLVLPTDPDPDVQALYLEPERPLGPDQVVDRRSVRVRAGERLSFATYFNAFPAAYWRRWTIVDAVTLTLTLEGAGASVTVFRSMPDGRSQRVDGGEVGELGSSTLAFDLPLEPFADGGWYWYDVAAAGSDAVVTDASWSALVPESRAGHGTVAIGITTMNRPDLCAELIAQIGGDPDLRPYLDEVFVAEQGTRKVTDSPTYAKAHASLGDLLRVVEQDNLGGSGGYARGQLEALRRGSADYFMCMDDDVVCEPESIIRAVTFGDLARRPTIVGGHMFSLYAKSRLHSFGEVVEPRRFWWQSAENVVGDWDFKAGSLRSTPWLHSRVDVDFNGWFMALIPLSTLSTVGLSLPLFIKWDDLEFGLRAKEAGVPTVTLPGAAVWHIPWTDKNDGLDWQSYFHQRNRFVSALLHSRHRRGGILVAESLAHQMAHLVAMQYSTVVLQHRALDDVLRGPERLHEELGTKLAEVRGLTEGYLDAQLRPDSGSFPAVRPARFSKLGTLIHRAPGPVGRLATVAAAPVRHFLRPRPPSREHPEAEIRAGRGNWQRIARYDSAVVSMPDGTAVALYRRDPRTYRRLLRRTIDIHLRLYRQWPALAAQYRSSLRELASPESWEKTLQLGGEHD